MRLWSLHPRLLDKAGLGALWREALGAKAALEGRVKGYANHPQLIRFKEQIDPVTYINTYLFYVYQESLARGYNYDRSKIDDDYVDLDIELMEVNAFQYQYEVYHLCKKLKGRDPEKLEIVLEELGIDEDGMNIILHPLFEIIDGPIESWEVLPDGLIENINFIEIINYFKIS